MKIINVGLLGYGLSGRVFHAPVIRSVEGFRITWIMTGNAEAIKTISDQDPTVRISASADEILEAPAFPPCPALSQTP